MSWIIKRTLPVRVLGAISAAALLVAAAGEPVQAASSVELAKIKVLDLDTAVAVAVADNPSLAAARQRVLQAAAAVQQASSAYWPQLEATAGGSRVDLSDRDYETQTSSMALMSTLAGIHGIPGIPTAFDDPENYFSVGLQATWLVFNGFARKFSVAAARYGEQAAVQAHADARRQLLSAVIYAYLSAQLAKENIVIARADAAFNNRLLTEAQLRYDVGAGALSDVLNFQVQANAAQIQITQNELSYQQALMSLAVLMGVAEGRLPDPVQLAPFAPTTDQELAALDPGLLIRQALDQRPDVSQLASAVQAAEAGVQTAKSGYYPAVVLSAGIEGQRPEDPGFEGDDFGNTIALGLSWNLFSGGLTRAQVSQARAKVSELNHNLDYAKMGVANEVQSAVANIQSIRQQVGLQENNTKLVQQQRDLVEKEYTSGVGSLVRLNDAQRTLTVTQGRLVLTRVALRQAWYNLQAITGQILAMFGSDTPTQSRP